MAERARHKRQITRTDAELGQLRFCRRCAEWWPDDEEFWQVIPAGSRYVRGRVYERKSDVKVCLACRKDRQSAWHREQAFRERTRTRSIRCATPGCLVLVPAGRGRCYGCQGATVGPLTFDRLIEYGMAA